MKLHHFLLPLALMASAAACSDGLVQEPLPEGGVAVRATIERLESRAAVDAGKVTWSAGDRIAVLLSNNTYATFKLNDSDAGKTSGSFSGVIFGDGVTVHPAAHAFYPASLAASETTVTIPSVIEKGSDFDNTHAFMKAGFDGATLNFSHIGGVLRFKLNNVPAGSSQVVYTTLDGQNITGDFTLSAIDGMEVVEATSGDGSRSSVTVKFDALAEASDIILAIPMPVGSYTGISLSILDAEGQPTVETVEVASATNTIDRAAMVTMPAVTFVTITAGADLDGKATCNGNTYETIAEAVAANPGATAIELYAGEYTLPGYLKDLTITGQKGKTVVPDWGSANPTGYQNVTMKNITFNLSNSGYKGFQHATAITFEDCDFSGLMFGYGTLETYRRCTFNQDTREYHMWTYGANSVYEDCTFTGQGKFLHLYNEDAQSGTCTTSHTVEVTRCHFVNTGTNADKAAVVLKSAISSRFTLTLTDCTTEGLFPTNFDPAGLWQVDGVNPDRLSITVDGVEVYPPLPDYSQEADGSYTVNTAAGFKYVHDNIFNTASSRLVINLKAGEEYDMEGLEYANSDLGYDGPHPGVHITINGNGATIKNLSVSGLQASLLPWTSQGFTIRDLTIKDSSFISDNTNNEYCAAAAFGAFCDYTSVEVTGCTLDNVTVGHAKYVGGLVAYCSGSQSKFTDCTITGCTIISDFTKDGTKYQGHCGALIGYSGGGTVTNCGIESTTFDVLGARGGILAGTLNSALTGDAWVKDVTGLDSYIGEVGAANMQVSVTVK